MSAKENEYLLGSSDPEIERLGFQHEVWAKDTRALWDRAGIGFGGRVVDLGCGPGFAALPLSRLVGASGRIFAVDSSHRFTDILSKRSLALGISNIEISNDDAYDLSLEAESADFVFSRWMFCFLSEPEAAVREAVRVLRPGGSMLVLDYFNYLSANVFPKRPAIDSLFDEYLEMVVSTGGSYEIGGRLPAMMSAAGLEIRSLEPVCRIARPGSNTWRWVENFNELSVPELVRKDVWTDRQKADFEAEWERVSRKPDAFFVTPPMIAIVSRKPPHHET